MLKATPLYQDDPRQGQSNGSDNNFRDFFLNSPLSYQSLDSEGRYIDVNPAWEGTFGYTHNEIVGRKFSELMTEESTTLVPERFQTLKEYGEVRDVSFGLIHKNGQIVIVNLHGRASYDEGGNFLHTNCVLLDVTKEHKMEVELIESEKNNRRLSQQLQALLDGIPDRILLVDIDLKMIWTNQTMDVNNKPFPQSPIGQYCYEMMNSLSSPCEDCPVIQSINTRKPYHQERINPNGEIWSRRAFPVLNENGKVLNIIEIGQNITELVKLREDAARTGQLAALGELSAGVAHEINNPINGVINYAQLLLNRSTESSQDREIIERIIKEGDRIALIVNRLLSYARNDRDDMEPLDLSVVLENTLGLIKNQYINEGIQLKVDIETSLPKITGNINQLQQLLLNIIGNARHALQENESNNCSRVKVIKIKTKLVDSADNKWIEISIRDNGIGIPSEMLHKIKQPFFTTKPSSKGTGLGLSICCDIVNNHGGDLSINSSVNDYTNVTIKLPVHSLKQ